MESPLISVIVPVYNVEPYLDRCVNSLVSQTYKNLEIILVDDGSTDASPKMCDNWAEKDKRIRVIHKNNGGAADARNAGLDLATGEYIAFVDSDDWIDLNYYEILYKQLIQSNAQIAASGVILSYDDHEDMTRYAQKAGIYTPEEALQTIQNNAGFLAVAWNKLYEKNIFQKMRFPCGVLYEDEFVIYRLMSRANRLVLCSEVYYHYQQRHGSVMTENAVDCEKQKIVLEAYIERISFFKQKYPRLLLKDKCLFCLCCYNVFCLAQKQNNAQVMQEVRKKRKKISFSISEFFKLSAKEKIYVFGTRWLLPWMSRVAQWRNRK